MLPDRPELQPPSATIVSGETSLLLLVAPALAALITRFVYYRNLRDLGWGLPKPRFALVAYALRILVSGSVFVLVWLLFAGYYTTGNTDTAVLQCFITTATVGILAGAASSFGEELGWRGFLVMRLGDFGHGRSFFELETPYPAVQRVRLNTSS